MAFNIGIDGGGTKTNLVLTDENLKIVVKSSTGRTNPLTVGAEDSARNLFKLIETAVSERKNTPSIESIVAGLAGCGRKKNADEVRRKLSAHLVKGKVAFKNLVVVSDAEIALEGAFPRGAGAILIAGTGSIAFGKNESGQIFRCGGFGKILGDEGSGYSIGLAGLKALGEIFDGRGTASSLKNKFAKHFGIVDAKSLISNVYAKEFDIASAAIHVVNAAAGGDKVSRAILKQESDELVNLVRFLKKKMKVKKLNLCFMGGLLEKDNYYSALVQLKIKNSLKGINIVKSEYAPEIGAVLIAKRKNNSSRIRIPK